MWWQYAKEWAEIAPGFTFVVAVIAGLLAWRQLVLNRANQRETTAKAAFREYLRLTVQYPEVASANYQDLQGNERERYEWLVGFFLWSAEELLEYLPTAKVDLWTANLQMLADYHRDYFRNCPSFMEKEFGTYSDKTQAIIKRAMAGAEA